MNTKTHRCLSTSDVGDKGSVTPGTLKEGCEEWGWKRSGRVTVNDSIDDEGTL